MKVKLVSFNVDGVRSDRDEEYWWKNRKDKAKSAIHEMLPDILCLQEAENKNITDILSALDHYEIFNGKGVMPIGAKSELYNPIIWNDKFRKIESGSVFLSSDIPVKDLDSKNIKVLTWVLLKEEKKGITFFVCNTHLHHKSIKERKHASKLIANYIKALFSKRKCAVILMGDFNSRAWFPENEHQIKYQTPVIKEALPMDNIYEFFMNEQFKDAFISGGNVNCLEMNTYNDYYSHFPPVALRLDWILYFDPLNQLTVCHYSKYDKEVVSDHFPIIVEMDIDYPLKNVMYSGKNLVFTYCDESLALDGISKMIHDEIQKFSLKKNQELNDSILMLMKQYDYRFAAKYLNYCVNNYQFKQAQCLYNEILNSDMKKVGKSKDFRKTIVYKSFEELDNACDINGIYFYDNKFRESICEFLYKIKGQFTEYYYNQFDIGCRNAVVQNNNIKKFVIDKYNNLIVKKSNNQKQGKLKNEIIMYEQFSALLGQKKHYISEENDTKYCFRLAQCVFVYKDIKDSDYYLGIKELHGIPMDNLLANGSKGERRQLLKHYFSILMKLLDYGIIWGDMSPRNIIIFEHDNEIIYQIFDFEKSRYSCQRISEEERKIICRGQLCGEELCTQFMVNEVEDVFNNYFKVSEWDCKSNEVLVNAYRPEIEQILKGRNDNVYNLGKYNSTEKEIIYALEPEYSEQLTARYPGRLKFKTEHYLKCLGIEEASDYERKITEIQIAAYRFGLKREMTVCLACELSSIEEFLLVEEFRWYLKNVISKCTLIKARRFIEILDYLYHHKDDPGVIKNFCEGYDYGIIKREHEKYRCIN